MCDHTANETFSNEEWKSVLANGGVIVVDAFATWCGPCKAIAPLLVKLSDKYTDAKFYKIDVDELPDVAAELGVRAMPTLFLFKDGQKVEQVTGANPSAIEAMVKQGIEA